MEMFDRFLIAAGVTVVGFIVALFIWASNRDAGRSRWCEANGYQSVPVGRSILCMDGQRHLINPE